MQPNGDLTPSPSTNTTTLLHDADRRMGAVGLPPGGFSSVDDLVRGQAAFKRIRTEAASIQSDLRAMIDRFAAGAPAYGMSAALEESVVNGMRGAMRSDGGHLGVCAAETSPQATVVPEPMATNGAGRAGLVHDIEPICNAGDRLFAFVLAHRDEVVFEGEGHFLLSGEKDAEQLEVLTHDLEVAARQAKRALAERQRNLQLDAASVVPSLEGYRDW